MYPMIPPERQPDPEGVKGEPDQRIEEEPLLFHIAGFTTEELAHLAKNFLEQHGIKAVITTDYGDGGNGICLEVQKSQAKKASRLLKGKIR